MSANIASFCDWYKCGLEICAHRVGLNTNSRELREFSRMRIIEKPKVRKH